MSDAPIGDAPIHPTGPSAPMVDPTRWGDAGALDNATKTDWWWAEMAVPEGGAMQGFGLRVPDEVLVDYISNYDWVRMEFVPWVSDPAALALWAVEVEGYEVYSGYPHRQGIDAYSQGLLHAPITTTWVDYGSGTADGLPEPGDWLTFTVMAATHKPVTFGVGVRFLLGDAYTQASGNWEDFQADVDGAPFPAAAGLAKQGFDHVVADWGGCINTVGSCAHRASRHVEMQVTDDLGAQGTGIHTRSYQVTIPSIDATASLDTYIYTYQAAEYAISGTFLGQPIDIVDSLMPLGSTRPVIAGSGGATDLQFQMEQTEVVAEDIFELEAWILAAEPADLWPPEP